MLYYWYRIIRILLSRKFQKPVDITAELNRTFRVRMFDCDGLRVMTAFKYAAYMDFIRWELIARSPLYQEVFLKGLAPTLGSQKLIYRRPLKIWTRFNLRLQTIGWDDKWIYNLHHFEQNNEVKAVGVTRALIWRKDKPQVLREILQKAGVEELNHPPPDWVMQLFLNDGDIISGNMDVKP